MHKTLKEEIERKTFHLLALMGVSLFVYFVPNEYYRVLSPIVGFIFLVDFFNLFLVFEKFNIKFLNLFFSLLRHEERKKYRANGSTWILISIVACFALNFSKEIQVTGYLILAVADSCAALVGKKYGKKQVFDKTLEGSLAFFTSSFLVTLLLFLFFFGIYSFSVNLFFLKIFFTSFFLTLLELIAKKIRINDNFLIPVSFCLFYNLFDFLFKW